MKKRILFVVAAHRVYGSEQKMLRIMKGLKVRGHEIFCITQSWSDGKFNELLNRERIPYISVKLGFLYLSKPFWTVDTLLHYPNALVAIHRVIRQFKPHVYYHNSYKTLIMMSPIMKKEKVLFHVGDILPLSKGNKIVFQILNKQVNCVIAISGSVKENLMQLGINKPIKVIYNGVEEINIEDKFNINSGKQLVVGLVGHILPNKGHTDLIGAAVLLKDNYPDVSYIFIGDGEGEYVKNLQEILSRNGLQEKFTFAGYIFEKNIIYSLLTIAVVCSRREALGNSAIEAMLAGVPVIATNVGGLPEIIKNGETGFLYTPGDIPGLAKCLEILFTDQAQNTKTVRAAKDFAEETFSINAMLNKLEAIISIYE